MPEKIICQSCGTVVDLPAAAADSSSSSAITSHPASTAFTGAKPADLPKLTVEPRTSFELRQVLLTVGYLGACAGVVVFFVLGLRFNDKASIFFWPRDEFGQTYMRFIKDECFPFAVFPLALVVAGAFSAVRLRGLLIGVGIAAGALATVVGIVHARGDINWANLAWIYNLLVVNALVAILIGLLFSKTWIVLAWYIPGTIALAFVGSYLNMGSKSGLHTEWLPFYAGAFQGLVIGLAARVAGWLLNRDNATAVLGAFIGGFLGLILADASYRELRELLRTPELNAWKLTTVSLYAEIAVAFVLALGTGLLGKRVLAPTARRE